MVAPFGRDRRFADVQSQSQASEPLKSVLSTGNALTSVEHEQQQLIALKRLIDARLQGIAQPAAVNGNQKPSEAAQDHRTDDLIDAEMDGAEQASRLTNSARVAPTAPMMSAPVPVAPVASMAPVAFMKSGDNP